MSRFKRFWDWLTNGSRAEQVEVYAQARAAALARMEFMRLFDKPLPMKGVMERMTRPSGPKYGHKPVPPKQRQLSDLGKE